MATGDFGGGTAVGVLDLATKTLESKLAGGDGRPTLCQGTALLFGAAAAAHARYDAQTARSWLCMWRRERPGVASVVTLEQPEPLIPAQHGSGAARDWWLGSAARVATLDWLSQPYVAELPLSVGRPRPSVLVLARAEPFTDGEGDALGAMRRHLLTLDRVLDDLTPAPQAHDQQPGTTGATTDLLTGRERQVLLMLSEGLLARSIAQRLAVSERTVHKHLGNLYKKLDAHDRLLAVRRAEVLGLLPTPEQSSLEPARPPARW